MFSLRATRVDVAGGKTMRLPLLIAILLVNLLFIANAFADIEQATLCKQANNIPKMIKTLDDYEIIASNVASIPTANAFSGSGLTYSQTSHPSNPKNVVSIDSQTGEVNIKADAQDNFDVEVKASNPCGLASATFNVEIYEEQ